MNKLLYISGFCALLAGCGAKKNLSVELEKISTGDLNKCVAAGRVQPEWFSTKISTDLTLKEEDVSVTASVRIRKDSVIWINVKKAAFQIATLYITPDSIKILNKLDKTYTKTDFGIAKQMMDVELDFNTIQDLFYGNPVGFDVKERYKQLEDSNHYLLSSHSERQIQKVFDKLPRREEKQYIQRYWITPESCKIFRTLINHLANRSSLEIINHDFKKEGDYEFPNKVSLKGTSPLDTVNIELNFSRYKVDKELSFPFKPSDKYQILDLINGQLVPRDSIK